MDEMLSVVREKFPLIEGKRISPDKLIFEERVKMNCFYCGTYNVSWRCPPKLPEIDYKKMLLEYENTAVVYVRMPLGETDYTTVRNDSSIYLHRALLLCEKWLYQHNNSTALSFIGGSCKLCKGGCGKERCNNPYRSRTPLEATGVNIIKTAAKYGIEIHFPTDRLLTRIGLIMWQNPIRVYKTTEEI